MQKPELMGQQQLASTEFSQGLFLNEYNTVTEPAWVGSLCGPMQRTNGLFLDQGWVNFTAGLQPRTNGWQLRTVTVGTSRSSVANYRDGLMMKDDDIRRDVHGVLNGVVGRFADATKAGHWLGMAVNQIDVLGETETSPVDGVAFFSAAHILGGRESQRNVFTKVQDADLGVTDRDKPTPVEIAYAINAAIKGLRLIRDKSNNQPNRDVKSFGLLCHSELSAPFELVAGSDRIPGSAGVDVINPKPASISIDVQNTILLASKYTFYVWAIGTRARPIVRAYEYLPAGGEYQVTTEDGVRFTHHDMTVPEVQKSGEHNWLAEANRSLSFGDWFSIVKCTISNKT